MRDTLYIAVPADAPGFTITGDWDPLGMRGTVSRTLVFKDVFVPDDAQMMPRGVYFQAAGRWPHMFTTLSPTYMGIAIAAYEFTVQVPARRARGHAAGEAAHVPHQADRGGGDVGQARADARPLPAHAGGRARGPAQGRAPARLRGAVHHHGKRQRTLPRWRSAPAAASRC